VEVPCRPKENPLEAHGRSDHRLPGISTGERPALDHLTEDRFFGSAVDCQWHRACPGFSVPPSVWRRIYRLHWHRNNRGHSPECPVCGGLLRVHLVGRSHRPTGHSAVRLSDVGWTVWSRRNCGLSYQDLAIVIQKQLTLTTLWRSAANSTRGLESRPGLSPSSTSFFMNGRTEYVCEGMSFEQ